jgi:hypothetical protein
MAVLILLLARRQGQCANANGELYRAKEAKDGNVNGDSEPDVRSQYIHNLIQSEHLPSIAGPEGVATPDGEEVDICKKSLLGFADFVRRSRQKVR